MERSKYLTTGEMARLSHVTKNTLFHYDQIGLFSPEIVAENDYRYYSVHQIEVLDTIIMLRDLGMSLKEIALFLEGRTPEKLLALFEKEEAQIQAQMEQLKRQRQWLREKRERVTDFLTTGSDCICIKQQPEMYYVQNRLEDKSELAYVEKITELMEAYENCNQGKRYEIGVIQQMEDIRQECYENYKEVVLVMKQKPKGMKYECRRAGAYLTGYYKGDWKNCGRTYTQMMNYVKEKHLELSGEFLEMYVVDSLMAEREEDYITEISVAVKNYL